MADTQGMQALYFTAGTAILAGLITAIAALVGHFVARANAKLQARLSANLKLAEMRQAWIISIRDDMARLQSMAAANEAGLFRNSEFFRIGSRIELHMNPKDQDYGELRRTMRRFLGIERESEIQSADEDFIQVSQRVLKREWDVLKNEIKSVSDTHRRKMAGPIWARYKVDG